MAFGKNDNKDGLDFNFTFSAEMDRVKPYAFVTPDLLKSHINDIWGDPLVPTSAFVKCDEAASKIEKIEKWVWIEGYKGTDKDMCCRGYQYTLNDVYDIPDETTVKVCDTGFHLCRQLHQVFTYYPIGSGNRYFKVKALVRESDLVEYSCSDKIAARSIKFIEELSRDEILKSFNKETMSWDDKYKNMAIEVGIHEARKYMNVDELVNLGYSETFACYVYDHGRSDLAKTIASQPGVSMDVKVLFIMKSGI